MPITDINTDKRQKNKGQSRKLDERNNRKLISSLNELRETVGNFFCNYAVYRNVCIHVTFKPAADITSGVKLPSSTCKTSSSFHFHSLTYLE